MLIDLAASDGWEAPSGEAQADVTIAGGGVAGLVLATRLARLGRRVIVLEASDEPHAGESQPLYAAQQIGQPTLPADTTRLRWIGGSSNHWGGWCRPLAAEDLASRPGAELPGWPFGPEVLAPYLEAASALLGFDPPPPPRAAIAGSEGFLAPIDFRFSEPPWRAGEALLPELAASPNVTLVLNAEVAGAVVDAEAGRVAGFRVGRRFGERLWQVPARTLVLAMGAMETVRFLLALNRSLDGSFGALVGRGYMQHLHGRVGLLARFFDGPAPGLFAGDHPVFLETTAALLAAGGSRVRFYAEPEGCAEGQLHWPEAIACAVDNAHPLRATAEQWPSLASRLGLGEGADWLGRPPLVIDWRPTAADKARLRRATLAYGAWLARTSGWRLRLSDWLLAEDAALPLPDIADGGDRGAAGHQLGGARMATTPDQGVSDATGLVFGSGNLYLASTALFPGGGHVPPTLTLAQLTLRLAETLERRLATP
jgi:choline dehydrogenase-like flavoprotein